MSDYTEFFLNRQHSNRPLECLEFAHPSFSKTYYVVRNPPYLQPVTVTHSDTTSHEYEYAPMSITFGTTNEDLDQTINITLADMGAVLPAELDAARSGAYADVKPTLIYRSYKPDDYSEPLTELMLLDVSSFTRDGTGAATFTASAPEKNSTKTGMVYDFEEFPMLRGFL